MKAIMISIKPKWVAKILNGEKTIEIRKTMPKCDLPIDVYIYCTKEKTRENSGDVIGRCYPMRTSLKVIMGRGKVIAKFTLKKADRFEWESLRRDINDYYYDNGNPFNYKGTCLNYDSMFEYVKGGVGYAWHVDNLEIFDKPMEISEFKTKSFERIKVLGSPYGDFDDVAYHFEKKQTLKPLTKAPQSWCYCESEE